jgi:hypothetical protein
VIDEPALVDALADETIAGAGLDVYQNEPHAPDALTAFPNVVLTPHVGGHTIESHAAMQDCVMANLDAFFAGQPLPYAVRGPEDLGPASRVANIARQQAWSAAGGRAGGPKGAFHGGPRKGPLWGKNPLASPKGVAK